MNDKKEKRARNTAPRYCSLLISRDDRDETGGDLVSHETLYSVNNDDQGRLPSLLHAPRLALLMLSFEIDEGAIFHARDTLRGHFIRARCRPTWDKLARNIAR